MNEFETAVTSVCSEVTRVLSEAVEARDASVSTTGYPEGSSSLSFDSGASVSVRVSGHTANVTYTRGPVTVHAQYEGVLRLGVFYPFVDGVAGTAGYLRDGSCCRTDLSYFDVTGSTGKARVYAPDTMTCGVIRALVVFRSL